MIPNARPKIKPPIPTLKLSPAVTTSPLRVFPLDATIFNKIILLNPENITQEELEQTIKLLNSCHIPILITHQKNLLYHLNQRARFQGKYKIFIQLDPEAKNPGLQKLRTLTVDTTTVDGYNIYLTPTETPKDLHDITQFIKNTNPLIQIHLTTTDNHPLNPTLHTYNHPIILKGTGPLNNKTHLQDATLTPKDLPLIQAHNPGLKFVMALKQLETIIKHLNNLNTPIPTTPPPDNTQSDNQEKQA